MTPSRLLMHLGMTGGAMALFLTSVVGAPAYSAPILTNYGQAAEAGEQGATIVGTRQVAPRTISLEVATSSFASSTVPVEVTFPPGYDADPGRRWPVTYYLAGTGSDQTTFRTSWDGVSLTKDFPSIIVAPKGDAGYWSDWFNNGSEGPPRYETFVARELIPLIDRHFRTEPRRSERAVMGESMGGYGALLMASRHPDLFAAAVSISGAVDTNFPTGGVVSSASPLLQTAPPDAIYGPRATQEVRWRGHNPLDIAGNLRDVAVQVRTGNGVVDPAREQAPTDPASCTVEAGIILPESRNMHERLTQLGIEHIWKEYDWGCHSVAMFQQQIRDSLPGILETFQSEGALRPASLDYRSIEPEFEIWNWRVRTDPGRATEFLAMHGANSSGLALTGSGDTSIVTPSFYPPNSRVTVVVDGVARRITADRQGRIAFTVRLGDAHLTQQYTLDADTPMITKRVEIRR